MADLRELVKALRKTADEVERELPVILLEQEITAKSLVQDRIQETGKDSKGQQLGEYSDNKIAPFFSFGKGKKATDTKLKKLAREKKLISYKGLRKLDGKQVKYVDLTFSGKMFLDIGVTKKSLGGKKPSIVIAPKTERSEKIADENTKRYGNFLAPNEEELQILGEDMAAEVEAIIERNLSGL